MVPFDPQSRHPHIRLIALTVAFVFSVQILPTQAWADPVPSAIAGFRSGKSGQDEKVRKVLAEQLKGNKDLMIEDDGSVTAKLQEYSSAIADPKSQAVVAGAYERFNTGMQYYRKLDLTNSLKEFNAAVRGYREGISVLRDNYYLLFSHLYLGIILNFLGREEEGKKFIQEMVVLDAERKTRVLPQRDFPPKIVELHKQITKEVLARPVSTLSVDSSPSGAKVMFDGSEIGKTPFVVKDIPSGQHFLSLDLAGYQYYGAPIQVNPGTQNFTTALKEKNPFQIYPPDARTDAAKTELKNIAQKLDVDVLILGQADVDAKDPGSLGVQAQTFDSRTSTFSDVFIESIKIKKPKFEVLASKIKETFNNGKKTAPASKSSATTQSNKKSAEKDVKDTKDAVVASNQKKISDSKIPPIQQINVDDFSEKSEEKKSKSPAIFKKWWFWAGIGALAVAGGGSFLLFQDRSATSNIVTIPNPL